MQRLRYSISNLPSSLLKTMKGLMTILCKTSLHRMLYAIISPNKNEESELRFVKLEVRLNDIALLSTNVRKRRAARAQLSDHMVLHVDLQSMTVINYAISITLICSICGALFWDREALSDDSFNHCCHSGTVRLSTFLEPTPLFERLLWRALTAGRSNITKVDNEPRQLNSFLSFAAISMNKHRFSPGQRGPPKTLSRGDYRFCKCFLRPYLH